MIRAIAAAFCALACQPALAQDPRIDAKILRIETRLAAPAPERSATTEKALRAELRSIKELYARYEADGLSDRERKDLSRRLFELGKSIGSNGKGREPRGGSGIERPS